MKESETVEYWIEISAYDLEVAKSLYEKGHYLYAGFMCHQSIEKMLKAHFVYGRKEVPPRIHRLLRLVKESGLEEVLSSEQKIFLAELEPLNIEARYPPHKKALYELLSKEDTEEIIRKTEALWKWLRQRLK